MPIYKYTAISKYGEKISGAILADNYKNAHNNIYYKKYNPILLKKINPSNGKINVDDLLMLFLHIDLQLKCGVRINHAIESFLENCENNILKYSLIIILEDFNSGISLGDAFDNCDNLFDDVIVELLKSAEKIGKLSIVISNILSFLKLQSKWKKHILRSLSHPLIIAISSILVLLLSIFLLGPNLAAIMQEANIELSALTNFLINRAPKIFQILLFPIILIIIFPIFSLVSKKIRAFLINALMYIPKIKNIISNIVFWQFCKILQIAIESKLDIMQSVALAINSVHIKKIKDDLDLVYQDILRGNSIFESFVKSKFMAKNIVSAISIGEQNSNIPKALMHITEIQYEEIIIDIKKLGQKLNYSIMLFAAGIFIMILYGLFFPLYSYIEFVGV